MGKELIRIDPFRWELPRTGEMRVPGRIFTSEAMRVQIEKEGALEQVRNVACLPGIIGASLAMPDIHSGYGFPIGGVAAFDWEEGIVSPGGVGYDINCGVRLAGTNLEEKDIDSAKEAVINELYRSVPSGIGSRGPLRLTGSDEKKVLREGARWAVENGFGNAGDPERTEDGGCLPDADPDLLSRKALDRGKDQLGTLGAGNHFLEVDVVGNIFDSRIAEGFGLFKGQVVILLHSGSRGLGYQVCDDFLAGMVRRMKKNPLPIPDSKLACAMIGSDSGRQYLSAMACAANYAWANRQILMSRAEEALQRALSISPRDLGLRLIYDVCHNIAKKEEHMVDGKKRTVCVHRKGATRSFPAGHPLVPAPYRHLGQPILIPGDMGTGSFVMAGTETAMEETFGSTCHGAGRVLSRKAAKRAAKGRIIHEELAEKGIRVRWTGRHTLSEEMPDAYKNVNEVVEVAHGAGISRKVAKLRPLLVIKG